MKIGRRRRCRRRPNKLLCDGAAGDANDAMKMKAKRSGDVRISLYYLLALKQRAARFGCFGEFRLRRAFNGRSARESCPRSLCAGLEAHFYLHGSFIPLSCGHPGSPSRPAALFAPRSYLCWWLGPSDGVYLNCSVVSRTHLPHMPIRTNKAI